MTNRVLASIICLSALFFGSVEVWSIAIIALLILSFSLFTLLKNSEKAVKEARSSSLLIGLWALFLLYAVLQTLPLPAALVRFLAPGSGHIWDYYSFSPPAVMSISLSPYQSTIEIVKGLAAFAVFASIARFSNSRGSSIRNSVKLLITFGFMLAVFGIMQKASWNGKIYWLRELTMGGSPFGPFVNRNHYAGLINMLAPLGLGLAFSSRSREKKLLFGFMTAMMAISIFFSFSRGGIISFFIGIAVFSIMMVIGMPEKKRMWMIIVFLALVLTSLSYFEIDRIIERFSTADIANEERFATWSTTLRATKDFWLTGSGPGTFFHIFPLYAPSSIRQIYDHAHNDYLELLLESGVIGALIVMAFFSRLAWAVLSDIRKHNLGIIQSAAVASAATMLVHSIFDFNLHIFSNTLMFAYILGIIAATSHKGASSSSPGESIASVGRVAAAAAHVTGIEDILPSSQRRDPVSEESRPDGTAGKRL